jgi:hypothetical protein
VIVTVENQQKRFGLYFVLLIISGQNRRITSVITSSHYHHVNFFKEPLHLEFDIIQERREKLLKTRQQTLSKNTSLQNSSLLLKLCKRSKNTKRNHNFKIYLQFNKWSYSIHNLSTSYHFYDSFDIRIHNSVSIPRLNFCSNFEI